MSERLPLIRGYASDAVLVHQLHAGALTHAEFLGAARVAADRLPAAPHVLNLCENRAQFLLAFAAALMRGQTTLLPPGRAPGVVAGIARAYPGSVLLTDGPFEDIGVPQHRIGDIVGGRVWSGGAPALPAALPAAIAFTSGSTGGPQPHVKSWRTLFDTAGLCAERFLGDAGRRPQVNIVATVPPQHMYSLELSIMMALAGGCATHAARPLFPADVRSVLESVPEPRMLVTTPVHLRTLAQSGVAFPKLDWVISATAPLSRAQAQQAEQALRVPVHEIYGCTEAGSMCTRRTLDGDRWRPYPELRLTHRDGVTHVRGPHLDAAVSTPDVIENHDDGTITLLGRTGDMVKVAGKRTSLTELTGKLLGVPGVEDGVVFMPQQDPEAGESARPAALVVAPALSEAQILDALSREMDPVFLPRPLRKVTKLPRNALGKLPRQDLLELLRGP